MTNRLGLMQGLFLVLVGIAWATRALIGLTDADFWNATTLLDYASVWTYSLAVLLIAPALLILIRQAKSGRAATLMAWVVAAGRSWQRWPMGSRMASATRSSGRNTFLGRASSGLA